jgi:hypothetical protein
VWRVALPGNSGYVLWLLVVHDQCCAHPFPNSWKHPALCLCSKILREERNMGNVPANGLQVVSANYSSKIVNTLWVTIFNASSSQPNACNVKQRNQYWELTSPSMG